MTSGRTTLSRRCAAHTMLLLTTPLISGWACIAATPPSEVGADVSLKTVDLRPIFARWGLTVRSQGNRGTCSVFAVTDAIEYAVTARRGAAMRFSPEFLNWAANQTGGDNQDGAFFSELWRGFEAYGICPEADWPYQAGFDPASQPSELSLHDAQDMRTTDLHLHWIKPWDVTTGLTAVQLNDVKQALVKQWPVCGGFRWPVAAVWVEDLLQMAPPSGVFDGHSVLLVGFRDDPTQPGGGVFIFRNSGRPTRDGYMTYEYASAYMNDAAWIDYAAPGSAAASQPALRPRLQWTPPRRFHFFGPARTRSSGAPSSDKTPPAP